MQRRDDLSPVRNWRGWLAALALVLLFGIGGALDNPAEQESYRDAARDAEGMFIPTGEEARARHAHEERPVQASKSVKKEECQCLKKSLSASRPRQRAPWPGSAGL
ncbi:hypothetical protein [Desulfovibrio sp. ZJ200]|uniref:hypothetical protein n=1 Tax=Desulfovibrio sp. ZJ200 TaxID=2709792 RepID=UPI00197D326D|nr:hypothetical protein [Desulfovibrio sp. ZJ200]